MQYAAHVPSPPLSRVVERLWALRDQPLHATERIVPTGTLELVVNLRDDEIRICDRDGGACRRLSGAVVSGAYSRYFVIDTRAHDSIIGVHFHPGVAEALLGVPAGAFADTHVDLDALWGRTSTELREQLCDATTTAERFALLEHVLRDRLERPRRTPRAPHAAVPFALAQLRMPSITVGDVAAEIELSHRRFIEVFTTDVGMTPKRFSRVARFQRALALARRTRKPDWSALAIAAGYFDQAHLINEFRDLAGMSPVAFLAASTHVKVDHAAERSNSSKP